MYIVGLTGGIATGKTTVVQLMKQIDGSIVVVDFDAISREIVQIGKPAYVKIVKTFGKEILDSEGNIDRKKLGSIVFSYEEARKKLNKITHPHILWQVTKLLLWHWIKGTKLIILDVPLLFEVKLQKLCNMVVVVYAPVELQLQRLMARNNLTESEANQRIASQMSIEEKKKLAHFVIDNSGDLSRTQQQVQVLLNLVQRKRVWFSRNNVLIFIVGCFLLFYFVLKFVQRL